MLMKALALFAGSLFIGTACGLVGSYTRAAWYTTAILATSGAVVWTLIVAVLLLPWVMIGLFSYADWIYKLLK